MGVRRIELFTHCAAPKPLGANRSKGDRLHKVTEAGSAPTRQDRVCGLSVTDARMFVCIKSAHKDGSETRWSFLSGKNIDWKKLYTPLSNTNRKEI